MNKRLLDGMDYTPSVQTDVLKTFRKHGFKPTTDAERKARQQKREQQAPANVTPISKKSRKA